jgi:3-dehydroquinate synthase
MIESTITVNLGERSHPIYIGRDMLSSFAQTASDHEIPKRLVVISDRNVAAHYLKPLLSHLGLAGFTTIPMVLPAGESQKSLTRAAKIFTELLKAGVGRKSAIIALGGGVVGDLSGFVAATYHRGVPFIQMPTTLLSQVDSSVGGKVAVNHPLGKNMIGAFYQPKFVWADAAYLRSLPLREVACGLGEIVKYGIIRDPELFAFLEQHLERLLALEQAAVSFVQSRCLAIKAQIISEDEKEIGVRVVLNLGHTVGHSLEAAGNYRVVKHGEGVLLGIIAESFIARELGIIDSGTNGRIVGLIRRIPMKANYRALKRRDILKAMGRDKKKVGSRKKFVLPKSIGSVELVEDVEMSLIQAALKYMNEAPS